MSKEPIENTKSVQIADLLEDALITQLEGEEDADGKAKPPSAQLLNVARQYLKDQGFVAGKRPNAKFSSIAEKLEGARDEDDESLPFDDYEEGAAG